MGAAPSGALCWTTSSDDVVRKRAPKRGGIQDRGVKPLAIPDPHTFRSPRTSGPRRDAVGTAGDEAHGVVIPRPVPFLDDQVGRTQPPAHQVAKAFEVDRLMLAVAVEPALAGQAGL